MSSETTTAAFETSTEEAPLTATIWKLPFSRTLAAPEMESTPPTSAALIPVTPVMRICPTGAPATTEAAAPCETNGAEVTR